MLIATSNAANASAARGALTAVGASSAAHATYRPGSTDMRYPGSPMWIVTYTRPAGTSHSAMNAASSERRRRARSRAMSEVTSSSAKPSSPHHSAYTVSSVLRSSASLPAAGDSSLTREACAPSVARYAPGPPESDALGPSQASAATPTATTQRPRSRHERAASIHSHSGPRSGSRSWRNPAARPSPADATSAAGQGRERASRSDAASTTLSRPRTAYGMATSPYVQTSGADAAPSAMTAASARSAQRRQSR